MSYKKMTAPELKDITKQIVDTIKQQKISTSSINPTANSAAPTERQEGTLSPNQIKRELKNLNSIFSSVRKEK
ncbi:hypothetical protein [Proteus faecis]|uniref:hypothetical protein n=1 Tax=Proteus faecis TaxID=2050967 RepID=UPI003075D24C